MEKQVARPAREIRAVYDEASVTVYQAYGPEIAAAAVSAGRFVPPFKLTRMTWIKPSFLWMMYRSGWAGRPGQERVLAIRISRSGFEQALSQATASTYDPAIHASADDWRRAVAGSDVRYQWDPERSLSSEPLPWRSLQLGLTGEAVKSYVGEWILSIRDVTGECQEIRALIDQDPRGARERLPDERRYPVSAAVAATLGMNEAV